MSQQIVEVSPGIATDSPVFQPPERNRDNEKPRYVTFLGSLIDAETVASRPWTKGGGIEVSNPCLRVVKNFIRKGRITPLLYDHHDFISYDVARKYVGGDPFGAGYSPQPIPRGYVPPALPPAAGEFQAGFGNISVGGPSPYGSLVFRWAFPGEQIQSVLLGSENVTYTNVRRGVVEHTSLAGHDYQPEQIGDVFVDRNIWKIQKAVFPDYPKLPILLDDIERLLDEAEKHTLLRAIVDDDRESLTLFRDYAHLTIENVHAKMRETQGKHPYVAGDFVLLAQLGMERQDRQIRQMAKDGGDSALRDMVKATSELQAEWMRAQIEEKQALAELHKRQVALLVPNENAMKASPLTQAEVEGFSGYGGQSGYSGFSGEIIAADANEVIVNDSSENAEVIAEAMADTVDEPLSNPVTIQQIDLSGERPAGVHHLTWKKMRKDAGLEE